MTKSLLLPAWIGGIFWSGCFVGCVGSSPDNVRPREGYIPDEATAIRVAEAVWTPIYGAKLVREERPYHAHLSGNVWQVYGSFPPAPPGMMWAGGGVVTAEIHRYTGRILRIEHEE